MEIGYPVILRSILLVVSVAWAFSAQAQQVSPHACLVSATSSSAVTIINSPTNGWYVSNPLSSTDQNTSSAENLYLDITGTAVTQIGFGTNLTLVPGQVFYGIPSSRVSASVNAATSGHRFTCVRW